MKRELPPVIRLCVTPVTQWGCYHAASLKFRRRDIAGALELYVRAAEAGHPSAAYWASAIYDGEGDYARDPERATYYLVKAAECGHVFCSS